jgi:DNA-binding response OmpR family regulator
MATKLGAISSLQKPFRPADLLAAVTGCLEAAGRGSPSRGGVASSP